VKTSRQRLGTARYTLNEATVCRFFFFFVLPVFVVQTRTHSPVSFA